MKVDQILESTGSLPKIKWKIASPPTGKFSSFHARAWPMAWFEGEEPAIMITCEDSYRPANIKSGEHKPLKAYVADHSTREKNPNAAGFEWRKLKGEFKTLDEAKKAAIKTYTGLPQFWPKALRPQSES